MIKMCGVSNLITLYFNPKFNEILSGLVSGFQGSSTLNTHYNKGQKSPYKWGHIATTYAALSTLVILGDPLERVHRESIIKSKFIIPEKNIKTKKSWKIVFETSKPRILLNEPPVYYHL